MSHRSLVAAGLAVLIAGCSKDFTWPDRPPDAVRQLMIEHLWGQSRLPDSAPDAVSLGARNALYDDLPNLGRLDVVEIDSGFGPVSYAIHLHPAQDALNRLIIYHQGHEGGIDRGQRTLEYFLTRGYAILGFAMPGLGPNAVPEARLPSGETIPLGRDHADLAPFEDAGIDPLVFFVEPVVVGLNYIERSFDYARIDMIGVSGGGWTTQLAAALDPRIERSYPVAGGLPFHMRRGDAQDYEQLRARPLFDVAIYLDWYLLGGYGHGRRQLQILNLHDPCCFRAAGREQGIDAYVEAVVARGADLEVLVDDQHVGHEISLHALKTIEADLAIVDEELAGSTEGVGEVSARPTGGDAR